MRLSSIITGTLAGSIFGFVFFAPMTINHWTREQDGWEHLVGGLACAVVGFIFGLLHEFDRNNEPPRDRRQSDIKTDPPPQSPLP